MWTLLVVFTFVYSSGASATSQKIQFETKAECERTAEMLKKSTNVQTYCIRTLEE